MVEPFHSEFIEVVKAKGTESVTPRDKKAFRIHFARYLPNVQLDCQDREHISTCFWLYISSPDMQINNLGVVKCWPIAEDFDQLLTVPDECSDALSGLAHVNSIGSNTLHIHIVRRTRRPVILNFPSRTIRTAWE